MDKTLRCRDVGMNCDFVARGNNEEEVLTKTAEHAREEHGIQDIPDDLLAKVRAAIKDE